MNQRDQPPIRRKSNITAGSHGMPAGARCIGAGEKKGNYRTIMQTCFHRSIEQCEYADDYYFPFYKWRGVPDVKHTRYIYSLFDRVFRRKVCSKIKRETTQYTHARVRFEREKHIRIV